LLSAKCQTNLDQLKRHILRVLENYVRAEFTVPITGNIMPFLSWVHEKTDLHKEEFGGDSVQVVFEATPAVAEQIKRKVQDLNGKFQLNPTRP
jgi:50S ribosomal subunit-associated GTPase HflX